MNNNLSDESNELKDLLEFKNHLIENYNLDAFIKINDKKKCSNIYNFYFSIFLILILIYIILLQFKISFLIIFVLFILFILLLNYFIHLKLYYCYDTIQDNVSVNYNDNDLNNLNTGDILQEYIAWNFYINSLCYLLNIHFLHNYFIIKFKNINYIVHFVGKNCGYPKYILNIGSEKIEICKLETYLKYNLPICRYYRLIKCNKKINNNDIFLFFKKITSKKLSFSFRKHSAEENLSINEYQCMSFILTLLNNLKIIHKFNYQNFLPDDLFYLPQLSNNIYKNPVIFKY